MKGADKKRKLFLFPTFPSGFRGNSLRLPPPETPNYEGGFRRLLRTLRAWLRPSREDVVCFDAVRFECCSHPKNGAAGDPGDVLEADPRFPPGVIN